MDVIAIGETMVSLSSESTGLMRHSKSFIPSVAGAETNTMIGLSRLGHQTGWISRLGNDEFGKMILSTVKGEGIETNEVQMDTTSRTGVFFKEKINGSDVRVYYYRDQSAASKMSPKDLNPSYIENARYLYISGITPAISPTCKETIFEAIKIAKQSKVTVVFDPNLRKKIWSEKEAKETLYRIAGMADIVLPGINEGEFLFDLKDYKEIANRFINLGASLAVVKLGEKGAYFKSTNEKGFVTGFPVDRVVDPVGAGDGFAAGLLSGLLDELPVQSAVERACAIGAMVVTVNGDYEGLPDRDLLQRFKKGNNEDVSR